MLRSNLIAVIGLILIASSAFADTVTGSVREGNALYSEEKYEEALKKYKSAQVEAPNDERITFNLGDVQYKLGRFEEALSGYLLSVQNTDPKFRAQSYYNAGNALYRMGRLEDAVEQYLKAVETDPEDEDAKFNLEFVRQEIRRRMNQQQQRQQEQQEQQDRDKKEEEQTSDSQGDSGQRDEQSDSRESGAQEGKTPERKENEQKPEQTGDSKDETAAEPETECPRAGCR